MTILYGIMGTIILGIGFFGDHATNYTHGETIILGNLFILAAVILQTIKDKT